MLSFTRSVLILTIFNTARGALYVTFPVQGDRCQVSQPCQIKWMNDPQSPSTSTLGETAIDLVTGSASNLQAVQRLGGVSSPNVATALTFSPIPGLSPTQQYAIRFTSKSNPNSPIFSTFFSITGGSGTATPLPSTNSTSGSPAGSPSPIVGNKAPNASSATNATTQLHTSSAKNSTATANAESSAATHPEPSFLAMIGAVSLLALL